MTQYNCKYQILAMKNDYVPKVECYKCEADAINNPKCDKYQPISPLNLHGFFARNRLEDEVLTK